MQNTRERILEAALNLFAADGYEAVSVSTIAGALGITKGALYKHYPSKRHIFNSILNRMETQDAQQADDFQLPQDTLDKMEDDYAKASIENIIAFSKGQFRYWTENRFAASFRKMLTLEQYRSDEMNQLYQQYLGSGPLGYMEDLFRSIGLDAADEKALAFYGSMFLLYSIYDGAPADQKTAVYQAFDAFMDIQYAQLYKEMNDKKERI